MKTQVLSPESMGGKLGVVHTTVIPDMGKQPVVPWGAMATQFWARERFCLKNQVEPN